MQVTLAVEKTHDRFDVVAPELILPIQFDGERRNSHARPPEVRLIAAVLEDAVRCYLLHRDGTRPRERRIFRETHEWFAADEPEEPFSFVSICAILGLDPEALRAGLQLQRAPRQPRATAPVRGSRRTVGPFFARRCLA